MLLVAMGEIQKQFLEALRESQGFLDCNILIVSVLQVAQWKAYRSMLKLWPIRKKKELHLHLFTLEH